MDEPHEGSETTGELYAPGLSPSYRAMVRREGRRQRLTEVLSPRVVEEALREHKVIVAPNPLRRREATDVVP